MHILHETIGVPRLMIDSSKKNVVKLTVGPLPSGYGMTIGNALRRVLLSSLPGAAVVGVKIEGGVTHEYSTVPGVKESVLDIILNLRKLKLKKHSKGVEEVKVAFVKKGEITAKDLNVSSDVEILDPSQIIATCDKADPKKKMYLRIEKSIGFRIISNEDQVKEEDSEYILVDANFSPVVRVRYEVVPARVGEQIDLDQLEMELETNGSIDPEKAIKLAADVLESYFALFNKDDAYTDEDFTTDFALMKKKEEEDQLAAVAAIDEPFTPIDILGLSQRTLNALVNGKITSVEGLLAMSMSQLTQLRGFGQKAKTELDQVLEERGYVLPSHPQNNV